MTPRTASQGPPPCRAHSADRERTVTVARCAIRVAVFTIARDSCRFLLNAGQLSVPNRLPEFSLSAHR